VIVVRLLVHISIISSEATSKNLILFNFCKFEVI
jgi:hypothetical protein